MYENLSGVTINGKCFDEEKNITFFPLETDRISVVYGKNGSGKSTLTDAFFQMRSDLSEPDLKVAPIDREQKSIILNLEAKKNIYVFNETYIDENIRITGEGLDTIVLFGEQIDVEQQIEDAKKKISNVQDNIDKIQDEKKKFEDAKDVNSPTFHYEKVKRILKAEGGWAEKDAKIKNGKQNSQVSDKIINEICDLSVTENIGELELKFKETQKLLDKISDSKISFPNKIEKKLELKSIETDVMDLLSQKMEKPVLSERESLILLAIENGFQGRIDETKKLFTDENTQICPYCYQPVTNEYKKQVLESIQKVLNKDVEEHILKLKKINIDEYIFEKEQYMELDSGLAVELENQSKKCNEIIKTYKSHIETKTDNVFSEIKIESLGLNDNIIKLNGLIEKLESKRIEFNTLSKKIDNLQAELIEINKKIAHKSIQDDYATYKKQKQEKDKSEKKLKEQIENMSFHKEKLISLENKKKNVEIAIGQINKSLEYVFFSKDRLSIELKNDLYYLKSQSHYVKPCDVSCGERNIIALCYFFTQIMQNMEVKNLYSLEEFIVIDDPVSSFDFENKIGIISYLKKQINDIIFGNNQSKVLIFSHDLTTIFDLQKATEEIGKLTQKVAGTNNTTASWLEIKDGSTERFSKNRSEYTELLKLVYSYAKDKSGIDSINIGNTMRRVLEAFSTFNYKKGIQDISCDIEIMKNVPNKEYFENLMYRLVLHNESHFEEQIQNFHDGINFYDFISEDEKQKTAREVLCLIYLLNPLHIKAHLAGSATNEINQWITKLA